MNNDFFVGILSALIALILTSVVNRLNTAIRLNRIRNSIIYYLDFIAKLKLEKYIEDVKATIIDLQKNQFNYDQNEKVYDYMPVLTSEVLKSFAQHDLLLVSSDSKTYTLIIDLYYSIDFLKENMPLDIYNSYTKFLNNHFELKNIKGLEHKVQHIFECTAINSELEYTIKNLELKLSTANELMSNLHIILKTLSGKDFVWKLKYFTNI